MDALRLQGGARLRGRIVVSGSKNASLPIMAAALLAPGESVLRAAPDLADVRTLGLVLASMGVGVRRVEGALHMDATHVPHTEASYDLVRTMRASILVLGPLLARFGKARVSLPGGCAIGARPVDQHLKGLVKLGATLEVKHGYVEAEAPGGLHGNEIVFDMPTVTGTENLLLAATLARGTTVLRNAAREPEVVDLVEALRNMGADITGGGTDELVIRGCEQLRPFDYRVVCDRIEFGTFLVAGALAGDELEVVGGNIHHQSALLDKLQAIGVAPEVHEDRVVVSRPKVLLATDIQTAPYPGFPTDMQAQVMTLLALAQGTSVVTENIFENRFMHVAELNRLGADIRVEGGKAVVHGAQRLSGSTVMATDLRASASLVLAGLVAEGETVIRRIYHLDRGYERLEMKLQSVGANISRFVEE
jgi:UDP-N-acetylglucosamine 1-carboxyvinyltransferase